MGEGYARQGLQGAASLTLDELCIWFPHKTEDVWADLNCCRHADESPSRKVIQGMNQLSRMAVCCC